MFTEWGSRQCGNNHDLLRFSKDALVDESDGYENGYTCKRCEKRYDGTSYHCSECKVDVCLKCFRKYEPFHQARFNILSQERRKYFLEICQSLQS